MINIKRILCPVDFFAASTAAVNYAAGLAASYDAEIHLLHVITPLPEGTYQYAIDVSTGDVTRSMKESSMQEMNKLVKKLEQAGIVPQTELRVGDVYDEIKAAIAERKPDIIVMGTHGRRGVERWFIGSTTEKLLRHSPVPLVTISAAANESFTAPRLRRILVTTDFSDGTPDALAYAFSVAQENESEVTLLHILDHLSDELAPKHRESLINSVRKQLEDLIPAEARDWCKVVTRIDTGVPYQVILRTIEKEKIDLLVMNIHGKGMVDRALLGSTAERVVRVAPCVVLLIPPMDKIKRPGRASRRTK